MNEYEAKFQRERQTNPSDWVIAPIFDNGKPTNRYRLQYVGK